MTDRPILFSAPMIKALLAGSKTQTRRILKPQPERTSNGSWHVQWQVGGGSILAADATDADLAAEMWEGLRIQVGDRLWCRESLKRNPDIWVYSADGAQVGWPARQVLAGKRLDYAPSIHMPKAASRLTLTVTDVRVQRLQDITDADAIAEGITCENVIVGMACYGGPPVEITADRYFFDGCDEEGFEDAVSAYAALWDSINGAGAWAANPWVTATTFCVERRNIDAEG